MKKDDALPEGMNMVKDSILTKIKDLLTHTEEEIKKIQWSQFNELTLYKK